MPKPTAMMHKAIDLGWNKSPLNKGELNIGTKNIHVKMIGYPADEKMMKQVFAKMSLAVTGNDVSKSLPDELAEDLMRGGLNQGLETFSFNFEISGLSRQLTHELVRTRKASFAQQSMRHTDMGNQFNVRVPQTIADNPKAMQIFEQFVNHARQAYSELKDLDIPYQDCRMVCPIGTETYIIASYPISEFIATYSYRACRMFLWEIQYVFRRMREEVLLKFPWMEPFIKVSCEKTKKCMYQGLEDTTKDCEFDWRGDRVFKPNLDLIGLKGKAYGSKNV